MAEFGSSSRRRLATCHEVLQILAERVVKRRDCFVACGHRGEQEQNDAVRDGKSRTAFPFSKHNSKPSMAIDLCPWPEQWASKPAFLQLRDIVMEEWKKMEAEGLTQGFKLRWGGDWDGDGILVEDDPDEGLIDKPHWELV